MSADQPDPPKPRGRPRLPADQRCDARVNVPLPNRVYDALYQRAHRDRHSVPSVVRHAITRYLTTRDH